MADIPDPAGSFIRDSGGDVSHHPDEHADPADADARALQRMIENFRPLNEK